MALAAQEPDASCSRGMACFIRSCRTGSNGFSGGISCCLIFYTAAFCIRNNGHSLSRNKRRPMKKRHRVFGMNKALGKNWILLRGLARESAHWGDFVPLLQSTFPDAQITLLDLPGTGCFHRETSPSTIKAITDRVRRHALDKGFMQQPATILALSLGAMVAWEWMRSYPEDICGATLMNTSFADLSPFLSAATLAKL